MKSSKTRAWTVAAVAAAVRVDSAQAQVAGGVRWRVDGPSSRTVPIRHGRVNALFQWASATAAALRARAPDSRPLPAGTNGAAGGPFSRHYAKRQQSAPASSIRGRTGAFSPFGRSTSALASVMDRARDSRARAVERMWRHAERPETSERARSPTREIALERVPRGRG